MQPDHTENSYMFDLMDITKNTGITLTESLAMLPQNSVSTLVFGNEKAYYFSVGEINKDQIVNYAKRKNMEVSEIEKWMKQNISYEIDD